MRSFLAVVVRPHLWLTALRQAWRLAPPDWWRRAPFLPVPPTEYIAMRATIQYGDPKHSLETQDLLKYLSWCRAESQKSQGA
ncbi:MAG: hypothetical protein RIQ64_2192 [Actinomycetota bacterium]